MRLENLAIGGLLFSLIFVLGMAFFADMLAPFNQISDADQFNTVPDLSNGIYNSSQEMQNSLSTQGTSETNAVDQMFKGGYDSTKNTPYTTNKLLSAAIGQVYSSWGLIPTPVITFILMTLSILTIIAVLYMIMKTPIYGR